MCVCGLCACVGQSCVETWRPEIYLAGVVMSDGTSPRVGFLGGGMMASALIGGFEKAKVVSSPASISVSEPFAPMREKHAQAGRFATADNKAVAARSDVVWLAVKPDVIPAVLQEISPTVQRQGALIVSIAAGVTIAQMESSLPRGARVIRVMPNLPALVSELAAGFCCGTHATRKDAELVKQQLGSVGRAEEVPEKLMDAYVTRQTLASAANSSSHPLHLVPWFVDARAVSQAFLAPVLLLVSS